MTDGFQKSVATALRSLADERYQRRVWLASSGPEVSSFVEDVCQVFDDTGLSLELESGRIVFSSEIDANLRELQRAISNVERDLPPQVLVEHPRIQLARMIAAEIIQQLGQEF